MSMNICASNRVVLVAESDSVLGVWVASHLAEHHFQVDRVRLGEPVVCERVAEVILIEHEAAIDTLRATLDRSGTPTLVLVAFRDLAARVVPLLEAWHDVAPATEAADVVAWRLRRLIDLSRRSAIGPQALDPLTGSLNRNALERQLRHLVGAQLPAEKTGLLMLDLDRFKLINDRLGHKAGDRVLKNVAQLLPRSLNPGDLVARLGGDEFACVLTRHDTESVRRAAEQLLRSIAHFGELEALADPSLPGLTASARFRPTSGPPSTPTG